ncbi:MAG: hypothetical protein ACR2LL_10700 [Nitrosopumilus sp.]|uniref:hypothetical protein n=1 Tax=Nitrosopumilus sp. TaxID=2024843 RepID=UPI00292EA433|nr:hypothetical protein [Nitrosopumilus sp.]
MGTKSQLNSAFKNTLIMHCDDKRTLFVLKEEIEKTWDKLKISGFEDQKLLKQLNDDVSQYLDYKNSVN